jgi:hypothetical protein
MKLAMIAISTAALIASAPAVFAQGASSKTPGHEMQERGSKTCVYRKPYPDLSNDRIG